MPSGSTPRHSSPADASSAIAELSAVADALERDRQRVAGVAEPFLGTEREDCVSVIHEAERQLMMAARAVRRAIRTLGG